MPSNHLTLCHPLLLLPSTFKVSGCFPISQFFASGGQSIEASASLLPMNTQGWFPLGLTGLISLLSKELSSLLQHHSSKASVLQYAAFFMVQLSYPYITTGKIITLTRWTFVSQVMLLFFNTLSRLIIAFLPRSKRIFHFRGCSHHSQWLWSPRK